MLAWVLLRNSSHWHVSNLDKDYKRTTPFVMETTPLVTKISRLWVSKGK